MLYRKDGRHLLLSLMLILLVAGLSRADEAGQAAKSKYRKLPVLLRLADNPPDPVAFTDFEQSYEKSVHDASIEYLSSNPQLLQRIREDLGGQEIHWQLQELSHRLLYVPEDRNEVAELFTDYCRDAIADLLSLTGLQNPYSSISTMMDRGTEADEEYGIEAVIVQDLAQEYVARYRFSTTSDKQIEIGLSGQIAVNEVGSYSSFMRYIDDSHGWQFNRNRRTVWKSVSANPYTILMTPLEETLHIALRRYTEQVIVETVKSRWQDTPPLAEVERIVQEWLAVEEAVVGGLVHSIVPEVVLTRIPDLPQEWIEADLNTKDQFAKYRLLRQGIELVRDHGLKKVVQLYSKDPLVCRDLLTGPV